MIRQAHTYLVGAMGGATLIAIAIAVFVLLVSAQVFRDWPLAALGGGGDENAALSEAQPAAPGTSGAVGSTVADAQSAGVGGGAEEGDGRRARGELRDNSGLALAGGVDGTAGGQDATGPVSSGGGQAGGAGEAGGSPQGPAASSPGNSPSAQSSGGGSNGKDSGGGGGESSGGGGSTPASSPSSQVTETVNNTVNQVDEAALGGTLDKTGVTGVTEGVINGVAGPESTVGKVVDEAAGAVGGLLGGKR